MWISIGDTIPRGQISNVYGFHLHKRVHETLTKFSAEIHAAAAAAAAAAANGPSAPNGPSTPTAYLRPHVVYHGTHRDTLKQILHEGLRPTFGMLGHAIYFGSFWKAFRFATLTQDYKKRPGAIMRYYAFWPNIYMRNLYGPCKCSKCSSSLFAGCLIADHVCEWSKHAPAVMVYPEANKPISNEEFASLDDSMVLLDSVAYATATTDHHEPFNRSLQIL
jgi:hypothetical protein